MKWRCKSVRRQMFRSIMRISKRKKTAVGKRWPRKSKVGNQWAALDKWSHYGQTFKPVSMTSSPEKVWPGKCWFSCPLLYLLLLFSHCIVFHSPWPHELKHTRLPCPSLSPLLLPSIFPSIRVFSDESVLLIRWPEYWSFSFSISPFSEYSTLV